MDARIAERIQRLDGGVKTILREYIKASVDAHRVTLELAAEGTGLVPSTQGAIKELRRLETLLMTPPAQQENPQ